MHYGIQDIEKRNESSMKKRGSVQDYMETVKISSQQHALKSYVDVAVMARIAIDTVAM